MRPERRISCFIVKDGNALHREGDKNGQARVYVYLEDESGRRAAANLLAKKRAASPSIFRSCRSY